MRKIDFNYRSNIASHALFLAVLATIFVFLVARSWYMFPSVFPDEYVHSRASRLLDLNRAEIPGYLFYLVYSFTGAFGDHFLQAARFINVSFFISGSYIVFLISKKITGTTIAAIIGVVTALSPMNTYTTYFMPESMFFFVFWIMIYLLMRHDNGDNPKVYAKNWALIGLALGALSLVKPHALFIYPVLLLYGIFFHGLRKNTFLGLLSFTAVAALFKFGFGFLSAGMSGLTLFGSMYTDHARAVALDPGLMLSAARSISINLLGNFFLVVTILGLGFLLLLVIGGGKVGNHIERQTRTLAAALLLVLIPMVAVFSTSVALYDINLDNRLYLRYYNYVFPLLYILVGARLHTIEDSPANFSRTMLAAPFVIFSMVPAYYYTLNKFFFPYKLFLTDSPELYLLQLNPIVLFLSSIVNVIVLFMWIYRESFGLKTYIYLFLPIFIFGTFLNSFDALKKRYEPLPQDILGSEFRSRIPWSDHNQITIIGQNRLITNHAALYSMSADTRQILADNKQQLDSLGSDITSKWIVFTDSIPAPDHYVYIWSSEGMGIYKRDGTE